MSVIAPQFHAARPARPIVPGLGRPLLAIVAVIAAIGVLSAVLVVTGAVTAPFGQTFGALILAALMLTAIIRSGTKRYRND